jgi:hypothetical protein
MGSVGKMTTTISGAALALALSASLAAPAVGRPGPPSGGSDRIATAGTCSAGSTWTLSGRSRFLRVDVEARVETDRGRQRWVLRLLHNQTTIALRSRRATGGGVVKVKARVRNEPGPDTFTLIARNRNTAETCQGTLTF